MQLSDLLHRAALFNEQVSFLFIPLACLSAVHFLMKGKFTNTSLDFLEKNILLEMEPYTERNTSQSYYQHQCPSV